jgi:hypothetical protein
MGFDALARRRTSRIVKRRGKPMYLRRVTQLDGPNPAPNPPTITGTLAVVGSVSSGAASITLRAKSASGRLIAGDRFVLAGDPTIYTATTQVIAASNTFTTVSFSPPLTQPSADGAAATLFYAADVPITARVDGFAENLVDGTLVRVGDLNVMIPGADLTVAPQAVDKIVLDSTVKSIVTVTPVYAAAQIAFWRVRAR